MTTSLYVIVINNILRYFFACMDSVVVREDTLPATRRVVDAIPTRDKHLYVPRTDFRSLGAFCVFTSLFYE